MPHFGLMNPDKLDAGNSALLRAKLHVRGGKRRLSQGKITAGIAALYDAFSYGLQYKVLSTVMFRPVLKENPEKITDDKFLFSLLREAGMIDNTFNEPDFDFFSKTLDDILEDRTSLFNQNLFLEKFNNIMTQLEVMPISENELPPENLTF